MRFPAVPSGNPIPGPRFSDLGAAGPPSSTSRRPGAFSWIAPIAVALTVVGAVASVVLLSAKHRDESLADGRTRAESVAAKARAMSDQAPSPESRPPSAPEPQAAPVRRALAAPNEDAQKVAPAEWPPARAFTARCRAAGGGCIPECTELAGGRCLDPCFIHTPDCSKDCLKPDGTCGFPPPDAE